jgi:hypothetical protein
MAVVTSMIDQWSDRLFCIMWSHLSPVPGIKRLGREADHLHLVPRLRVRACVFMAWCLIKNRIRAQLSTGTNLPYFT